MTMEQVVIVFAGSLAAALIWGSGFFYGRAAGREQMRRWLNL